MNKQITVETFIKAPIEKIWSYWNEPDHITKWAFASDDWCAPWAKNDLRVGGKIIVRMEAKDGSAGFDLEGIYSKVEKFKKIVYAMDDRQVEVLFVAHEDGYNIIETFDAENENPLEMQRAGWQAILDNFNKHVTKDSV